MTKKITIQYFCDWKGCEIELDKSIKPMKGEITRLEVCIQTTTKEYPILHYYPEFCPTHSGKLTDLLVLKQD